MHPRQVAAPAAKMLNVFLQSQPAPTLFSPARGANLSWKGAHASYLLIRTLLAIIFSHIAQLNELLIARTLLNTTFCAGSPASNFIIYQPKSVMDLS